MRSVALSSYQMYFVISLWYCPQAKKTLQRSELQIFNTNF